MDTYVVGKLLGKGFYGTVHKVVDPTTQEKFAQKDIVFRRDKKKKLMAEREIALLQKLKHANIISLRDSYLNEVECCLILEYMDIDLHEYMKAYGDEFKDPKVVKMLLRQLLEGVAYCHSQRVIHRDLKPKNLLLLMEETPITLKLGDFGLGKEVPENSENSPGVQNLSYRAPEVLLNLPYDTEVDMWSVGCIFGEMANQGKALFKGSIDTEEATMRIFSYLGTPDEDTMPGFGDFASYPKFQPKDLKILVPTLNSAGLDLLKQMLCLDPRKRITAADALKHEYFNDDD